MTQRKANRLATQTSPYLLQHSHNPVDWYPWGDEAFGKAAAEDRPILLSVGYAACHWCHVMERESFEDEATAEVMNRSFICVKVDREERPDIDSIYMEAVQAMTGGGGWPMTVFLTPEGEPFYAGTYFPKEDRYGMPAFRRVLAAVEQIWEGRRDEVREQSARIAAALSTGAPTAPGSPSLSEDTLRAGLAALRETCDPEWGGFGGAPKFPPPMAVEFLLRCHLRGWAGAMETATRTLEAMAAGGIRDQVGGGFHRYSVDPYWHVPHFEKMLYDNALLSRAYLHAWQLTRDARFERVARTTIEYMLREMRHPDGAFFSSQDADSEGEEGRFYTWSYDELVSLTSPGIARSFGARPGGNWEETNVLRAPTGAADAKGDEGASPPDLMSEARVRLFEARERRTRPATDDKILAAWNGLAVVALAEAGRALGEASYTEAAFAAADFVLGNLRRGDGRLMRSWRAGRADVPAYLDDHALMAEACLVLYEATHEGRYFLEARTLAEETLRLFRDDDAGGFHMTGSDAEELLIRPKDVVDTATPSGNSAAALMFLRLAHLTGDRRHEDAGVSALNAIGDSMLRFPSAFAHALCALDYHLSRVKEVALVGEPDGLFRLSSVVWDRFLPNRVLAASEPNAPDLGIELLRDRPVVGGEATAYVCEHFVCRVPTNDPAVLAVQLDA